MVYTSIGLHQLADRQYRYSSSCIHENIAEQKNTNFFEVALFCSLSTPGHAASTAQRPAQLQQLQQQQDETPEIWCPKTTPPAGTGICTHADLAGHAPLHPPTLGAEGTSRKSDSTSPKQAGSKRHPLLLLLLLCTRGTKRYTRADVFLSQVFRLLGLRKTKDTLHLIVRHAGQDAVWI